MTAKNENATEPETEGPCPPLNDVTEDEKPDTVLGKESDADFDAEETNSKENQSE
jgi:hypothetical protein